VVVRLTFAKKNSPPSGLKEPLSSSSSVEMTPSAKRRGDVAGGVGRLPRRIRDALRRIEGNGTQETAAEDECAQHSDHGSPQIQGTPPCACSSRRVAVHGE